ncbi:type-2 ice-structuring protein-like [Dunckerocampus dactyliophorus]|uniref:type-2 ice-structuring protein-like n=1 Tax=Dunckerocampus dactyliophorus TaxID=161453 RepID=UPI00240666C0|nr:type-2 ice-structuring protein-like [Dunckerocampus dactyliophorus]
MALACRVLSLLCGISGLITGARSELGASRNQCPEGWTRLDNRCFIIRNAILTFAEAEENCKSLGGNLASIHSPVEQALIDGLTEVLLEPDISGDFWIGLSFSLQEQTFVWTDGSDFDFDILLESVGAIDGIAPCSVSDGEAWFETSCTDSNRFICVRDVFQCVSICMQEE